MSVSIVIPTYKRPDYLSRLLESIARQTFQNFEVIIVDDNSPNREEYVPVIAKYENIFKEFNFLSNDTNRGAPHSRNRGIRLAKYDLIALVDDDDEWLPEKLTRQVELFRVSSENVGIVYTWTDSVNERGEVVHCYRSEIEGNALKEILKECFIPSPSVMVRKNAIEEAGLFDEAFPSCQDWDMWTRVLATGNSCAVIREVLTIYRKHQGESIGLSLKARQGYLKYYKKHLKCAMTTSPSIFLKMIYRLLVKGQ